MTCPPIIVFAAIAHSDTTPDHMKYAAAMVTNGKPGSQWMCTAATPEAARAKLEALWDKAYPQQSKRGAHLRKPATASVVPNDADSDLIVV